MANRNVAKAIDKIVDTADSTYVIYGKAGGFNTVDLGGMAWDAGNVDGLDDALVAGRHGAAGDTDAGAEYVMFDKAAGFRIVDLGEMAAGIGDLITVDDILGDLTAGTYAKSADSAGDAADTLTLNLNDVLSFSDTASTLLIKGDSVDTVTLSGPGWITGAQTTDPLGVENGLFTCFTNGAATVLIDSAIVTEIT